MRPLKRIEYALFVRSRDAPFPWGPVLRALRYPAALLRDWTGTELNVRAMSLAYSTLLSLVPLIAFSISILNSLGAHANLAAFLYEYFRPIGRAAPELARRVMLFVHNLRGAVLGTIGLAFLVAAVVSTMHKIEASFNAIWRTTRPRSTGRRFAEYLAVVVVGPLLLAAALGLLAAAHDSPFARWLHAVLPLQWTFSLLGELVPYVVVTAVFTTMYAMIPNTRVKPSAAVTGGISAGVLWALIGRVFTAFILYSSQMMAIYQGFAVVLTTLIWVYISWLVVLIGAQLSFYRQNPQYLRHGQRRVRLTWSVRERAAFAIMYFIGRDHASGGGEWTPQRLAAALDLPGSALDPLLDELAQAGLLVTTGRETLQLGRDPRIVTLAEVLDAVREPRAADAADTARFPAAADALADQLERASRGPLTGRTLGDWIASQ